MLVFSPLQEEDKLSFPMGNDKLYVNLAGP